MFPLIYKIVHDYRERGLTICLVMNLIYELLKKAYLMNEECYRLLLFRYIFLIAYGCYLAMSEDRIKRKHYIIGVIVGLVYMIVVRYIGITPYIMDYWTGTSCLVCLWILPIVSAMIRNDKIKCAPLELLGRASYNIFLIQMLYYSKADIVYSRLDNRICQVLISLFICSFIGIIFYYIETPITKYIIKKLKDIGQNDASATFCKY